MSYKKCFVLFFLVLLFMPVFLQVAGAALNVTLDVQMNNEAVPEKPSFILTSFVDGSYQDNYESWIQKSYGGRNAVVKTYNQLRFSIWGGANNVVGKNKNIFQQIYIDEYLILQGKYDFSTEENQKKLIDYLNKVEFVTQKLEQEGKILILVTTPSKCDFYANQLPGVYGTYSPNGRRAIDCLREYIRGKNIYYIDASELSAENTDEYPAFYNTGIHWSRPVEQKVSLSVLEEIERIQKWNINKFELGDINISSIPYWRDDDIWNLLNLWEKADGNYFEYETRQIQPENNVPLNILIQGGSFSLGFREDFYKNEICENLDYVFYNQHIFDMYGNLSYLANGNNPDSLSSDWSMIDTNSLIENRNVFIIEMNEEHIYALSNGFIDFLYEYYMKKYQEKEPIAKLDLTGDYQEQSAWTTGIYPYEKDDLGTFAWTQKVASVSLTNSDIALNGLEMVFDVPEQIFSSEEIEIDVYINGELVETALYNDSGTKNIIIEGERLSQIDKGNYFIELNCSADFCPAQLEINGDDRMLALKIRYIGELR